jgi:nicotinamidase-related amidase
LNGGLKVKRLLVVVDMQNDFIYGPLGSEAARAIVPRIERKIDEYSARGDSLYFTRDTHGNDYLNTQEGRLLPVKHCVKGTSGWEIPGGIFIKRLEFNGNCRVFDKPTFMCMGFAEHADELRGYKEIELVGLVSSICVLSNALLLKGLAPETKIIADAACVAGLNDDDYIASLKVMESNQIEVVNAEVSL